MLSFLPNEVLFYIYKLDFNKLYEIRLRANQEVTVFYDNKYILLKKVLNVDTITCKDKYLSEIVENITNKSIYAFNEEIKNGFITTKFGVRVGLCGKVIFENGQANTITNFSSINIRIPHNIYNSSNKIFHIVLEKNVVKNTLIFSAPFMGKTTILKDLINTLNIKTNKQILIIDERFEFNDIKGDNIDKIQNSNKEYALQYSIRSMAPEIIICDEISSKNDVDNLKLAKASGITVIATAHADSFENLLKKYENIKDVFDVFIELDKNNKKGIIKKIIKNND